MLLTACDKDSLDAKYLYKTVVHRFFQKYRSHLRILDSKRVARSKFHTNDPQMLDATVQNVVAWMKWHR